MSATSPVGAITTAGWAVTIGLMIAGAARHPACMQHSGLVLCIADVVLASLYMAFSFLIWHPNRTGFREAGIVGGQLGVVMGAILIASHAVESFVTSANSSMQLIRGAGSLLLTLGLLGVSGSATWRRTRSPVMSIVAGLCCASIAAMMLLSFALFLNLTVEGQMESRLDSAFLASGFTDVGAFLCRNALESALQILVQLSVAALVLSTAGCLLNAWLDSRAKVVALVLASVAPLTLLAGVLALSYAESLPRSSRPPLVLFGGLSVLAVLCIAHPIWSSLRWRRKLAFG